MGFLHISIHQRGDFEIAFPWAEDASVLVILWIKRVDTSYKCIQILSVHFAYYMDDIMENTMLSGKYKEGMILICFIG